MVIYASSPDALAQRSQGYDDMYSRMAQENANRNLTAQQEAVRNMLTQNAAAQSADEANQQRNFSGQQEAANRSVTLSDQNERWKTSRENRTDSINEKQRQQVFDIAKGGGFPDDARQIAAQNPWATPADVQQIYDVNTEARLARFNKIVSDKINAGLVPLPEDAAQLFTPGSSGYQRAIQSITSAVAPIQKRYDTASAEVERGNEAKNILKYTDPATAPQVNTPLLPIVPRWTPAGWLLDKIHPAESPNNIAQLNSDPRPNAQNVVAMLKDPTYQQSIGITGGNIPTDRRGAPTGDAPPFAPTIQNPNRAMPAAFVQGQQNTATAPVVPQVPAPKPFIRADGKVRVIDPKGIPGFISQSVLSSALASGYKIAPSP